MLYSKFISLLARLVPPRREFIFRSAGHVRYLGVGRFGQISFMLVVALVVGWMGFASARYVSVALAAAERNVRIATSDRIIRNMQEEINELTRKLESTAGSAEHQAASEEGIAAQNEALRDQIAKLESERKRLADQAAASSEEIATQNDTLQSQIAKLESERKALSDQEAALQKTAAQNKALQEQIAKLEGERDRLADIRDARDQDIAKLNEELIRSRNAQQDFHRQLNEVAQLPDTTDAEREQLAKQIEASSNEISRLNGKIGQLTERLALFTDTQSDSISRLGEGADQGIAALERTLTVAGLDIPLMLERVLGERSDLLEGVGGPMVALEDESGSEAGEKLAVVEQRLLRLHGLQGLMKHLPLAAPLDEIRISSGYGRRRDPFNNRLAMHPGMDFASRKKNAIHVTAPGTVTYVGWNGGYGKTVEVDHGLGIRTRYAHMSRIFVERGQKLEFREKVGLVGNTGRSTSSHLHYEIMVDGQQLDPANFLRAGQYVFKN
ncbi:MAG: peptidoglycan DD-metalloendopeptidase family protein [Alphaproteobacteria bacterium]|nr:peptidoglycan DD-metalloendopeptidase family protein [Alphaproteobacteria bacterium]